MRTLCVCSHPSLGQTIHVTEGIGRCQREGGPVEEIRPGDRVFFEPRERARRRPRSGSLSGFANVRRVDVIVVRQLLATPRGSEPVQVLEHALDEVVGPPGQTHLEPRPGQLERFTVARATV
jgi:hypothetical protein